MKILLDCIIEQLHSMVVYKRGRSVQASTHVLTVLLEQADMLCGDDLAMDCTDTEQCITALQGIKERKEWLIIIGSKYSKCDFKRDMQIQGQQPSSY